jgi:hypothetical protein
MGSSAAEHIQEGLRAFDEVINLHPIAEVEAPEDNKIGDFIVQYPSFADGYWANAVRIAWHGRKTTEALPERLQRLAGGLLRVQFSDVELHQFGYGSFREDRTWAEVAAEEHLRREGIAEDNLPRRAGDIYYPPAAAKIVAADGMAGLLAIIANNFRNAYEQTFEDEVSKQTDHKTGLRVNLWAGLPERNRRNFIEALYLEGRARRQNEE